MNIHSCLGFSRTLIRRSFNRGFGSSPLVKTKVEGPRIWVIGDPSNARWPLDSYSFEELNDEALKKINNNVKSKSKSKSIFQVGSPHFREVASICNSFGCHRPYFLAVEPSLFIGGLRPSTQWKLAKTLISGLEDPLNDIIPKENVYRSWNSIPKLNLFLKTIDIPQYNDEVMNHLPEIIKPSSINENNKPDIIITTSVDDHLAALFLKSLFSTNPPFWIHIGSPDIVLPSTTRLIYKSLKNVWLPKTSKRTIWNSNDKKYKSSISKLFYDALLTSKNESNLVYVESEFNNRIVYREWPGTDMGDCIKLENEKSCNSDVTPYKISFILNITPNYRFQWNERRTTSILDDISSLMKDTQVKEINIVLDTFQMDAKIIEQIDSWIKWLESEELVKVHNNFDNEEDEDACVIRYIKLGSDKSPVENEYIYEQTLSKSTHLVVACGEETWVLTESISTGLPTYLVGFKATKGSLRKQMRYALDNNYVKLFAPSPYVHDIEELQGNENSYTDHDSDSIITLDNTSVDMLSFISKSSKKQFKSNLNNISLKEEFRTHLNDITTSLALLYEKHIQKL